MRRSIARLVPAIFTLTCVAPFARADVVAPRPDIKPVASAQPKASAPPPMTAAPKPSAPPPQAPTLSPEPKAPTPPTPAPTPAPAPAPKKDDASLALKLEIDRYTLPNGLRVVLSSDHTSPTVAVNVVYDVGGRNEERGKSGFAHLFEHMMFQGSRNVPRGDHFKLITSHGGTLNGTTSEDRTNYYEMLPSSELALALWLEADRMHSLDISQSNFENQRSVVKEEYRMRVENAAYVPAEIRLQELTYEGYWPYEHSAIGTMRDLDAAELSWVRAFHDSYYAPNNAVVAVSGDFDPAEAKSLISRYFGSIPQNASVPHFTPPKLPEQKAPRSTVVEDAHAKLPAFMDAWTIPPTREADHYALELAAMILTDGESSRLYRLLVRERAVAAEVSAHTSDHRGPDDWEIVTKLSSTAKMGDVEKMVEQEIARLGTAGPSEAEVAKAHARISTSLLIGLQSNFARAAQLASYELFWGDAHLLTGELSRYLAVNAGDVRKAVAKYLTPERRSRVEVKPGAVSAKGAAQ